MSSALRACRFLLAESKSTVSYSSGEAISYSSGSAVSYSSGVAKPKPKRKAQPTQRPKGLFKLVPVSPTLASFIGSSHGSRPDAIRQVWAHVKVHYLQNPLNKKEILCDLKLRSLFAGRGKVNFSEVARLLKPHFVKTD